MGAFDSMSTTGAGTALVHQDSMGLSGSFAESLSASDWLKIAIIGEPGVGKSWLAATAPQPIRVFDFDDRAESLAGKPGLLIKSKPTMIDVEQDLSIAKARKKQGFSIPATWLFDSVTYMQRAMEEEIFNQVGKDAYKEIAVGPNHKMRIRKGWDTINGIQRYLEYLIAEFSALGNIIFVFHEKAEKDVAKSAPDKPAYTGDITIDPQYLANSLSLFNERYRIKVEPGTGRYLCQCKFAPNQENKFNAITSMQLDPFEPPNILAMIAKHKALRAAQAGKKI